MVLVQAYLGGTWNREQKAEQSPSLTGHKLISQREISPRILRLKGCPWRKEFWEACGEYHHMLPFSASDWGREGISPVQSVAEQVSRSDISEKRGGFLSIARSSFHTVSAVHPRSFSGWEDFFRMHPLPVSAVIAVITFMDRFHMITSSYNVFRR